MLVSAGVQSARESFFNMATWWETFFKAVILSWWVSVEEFGYGNSADFQLNLNDVKIWICAFSSKLHWFNYWMWKYCFPVYTFKEAFWAHIRQQYDPSHAVYQPAAMFACVMLHYWSGISGSHPPLLDKNQAFRLKERIQRSLKGFISWNIK